MEIVKMGVVGGGSSGWGKGERPCLGRGFGRGGTRLLLLSLTHTLVQSCRPPTLLSHQHALARPVRLAPAPRRRGRGRRGERRGRRGERRGRRGRDLALHSRKQRGQPHRRRAAQSAGCTTAAPAPAKAGGRGRRGAGEGGRSAQRRRRRRGAAARAAGRPTAAGGGVARFAALVGRGGAFHGQDAVARVAVGVGCGGDREREPHAGRPLRAFRPRQLVRRPLRAFAPIKPLRPPSPAPALLPPSPR